MIYLSGANNPTLRALAGTRSDIGFLATPVGGHREHIPAYPFWAADNGCFNARTYVGDDAWWVWLQGVARFPRCLFATAPDVVGDAEATLTRSLPWLPKIRALGYKAALVAQDGLEDIDVPWDSFDVLFIGGSTEWKLGAGVRQLVIEARAQGKSVHMGRVNSYRRLDYAKWIGCDSADGTFIAFGPDVNLKRLHGWMRRLQDEPTLWSNR